MAEWNHRGFEITMQGANFAVQVGGKRVLASSINAAKKAVDKHLDAKATAAVLNLPVVFFRSPRIGFRGSKREEGSIMHGAITGLDPETRSVVGVKDMDGEKDECVLPDSESNTALILEFIATEKKYNELRTKIDSRSVSVHFNSYGRKKPLYSDQVMKLQEGYKRAVRGEA